MEICEDCQKRVVVDALDITCCKICGELIFSSYAPGDVLCSVCAERQGRCPYCGKKIRG